MKWELNYTPGQMIEIVCEGETGYRAGHQYGPTTEEYKLLSPSLDANLNQVTNQESEQVAIIKATKAMQDEIDKLKVEIDSNKVKNNVPA